jgi:predicted dehydrogenase
MLRLGIVDFDSSHCIEFTRRFNHVGLSPDQYVDGARVVAGWPGTSEMAPQRIAGFRDQVGAAGVELVGGPEELIGRIDAVLISSLCGSAHLERARPFLEAGIPTFVDKPFACSVADADAIIGLARRTGTLLLHASALRFSSSVTQLRAQIERVGPLRGLISYGPAKRDPFNPGLVHYGIHAIEVLYALMGAGCESVACTSTEGADVVTGRWHDGRLATLRGARAGATAYGVIAYREEAVVSQPISTYDAYTNFCRELVRAFVEGRPMVPYEEIQEVTRFALTALASEQAGGIPLNLQ